MTAPTDRLDECTHGGDCQVHPDAQGLHNYDADELRAEVDQWRATFGESALKNAQNVLAERDRLRADHLTCVQAGRVRGDNESLHKANQAFTAENARLRRLIAEMEPVVKAAKAWAELLESDGSAPDLASKLIDIHQAVEQYRATYAALAPGRAEMDQATR